VKKKSKYYALWNWLRHCNQNSVTLTFKKIEEILLTPLPQSAHSMRAWWSNREQGGLQSRAWLDSGYRVVAIDIQKHRVTFQKLSLTLKARHIDNRVLWDSGMIRALRRHMKLNQSQFAKELSIRQATVSDWERGIYLPKPAISKLLSLVADRVNFSYS
jgi:DNA-binding transcriptional regulator YiaG